MSDEAGDEPVDASGFGPFVTKRVFCGADGARRVWRSRRHRKGLAAWGYDAPLTAGRLLRSLWMPDRLNWWIGVIFAFGSALFALGGAIALWPGLLPGGEGAANAVFLVGSVPFTIAAYLQLFQAANAPADGGGPAPRAVIGWRPGDIGWLGAALQLVGALSFNVNTLDAMIVSADWLWLDLAVWAPDFFGAALFLGSGYLAFAETCHARWAWRPDSLSWWITAINLVGCVAFMVSAIFAFTPPSGAGDAAMAVSLGATVLGALCFLVGALLMLPETADEAG